MKLIVGLGNPGIKYKNTRHNVGFMFVEKLAKDLNINFTLSKNLKCEIASCIINNEKVIIIKPQTFMNLSGEAVVSVMNFYKIAQDDILVVYDDMDIDVGKFKIKRDGSSAGHKGIQSIINHIGSSNIKRIRIGISKATTSVIDYVISDFSLDDRIIIDNITSLSLSIITDYINLGIDDVMNRYNR